MKLHWSACIYSGSRWKLDKTKSLSTATCSLKKKKKNTQLVVVSEATQVYMYTNLTIVGESRRKLHDKKMAVDRLEIKASGRWCLRQPSLAGRRLGLSSVNSIQRLDFLFRAAFGVVSCVRLALLQR